jgi:hypothetical protein
MTRLRDPAARSARSFARTLSLEKEGAGNAGCLLHPRSRVQNCAKKRTRAYRYSRSIPAFPAQWFYGLCRAPRRRIRLVTVIGELTALSNPVGSTKTSADLTPATGARTTRFCRTQPAPFVLRAVARSRKTALRTLARRRCRVHRIPPAFVTIAIRPSCRERTGELVALICPTTKGESCPSRYFAAATKPARYRKTSTARRSRAGRRRARTRRRRPTLWRRRTAGTAS